MTVNCGIELLIRSQTGSTLVSAPPIYILNYICTPSIGKWRKLSIFITFPQNYSKCIELKYMYFMVPKITDGVKFNFYEYTSISSLSWLLRVWYEKWVIFHCEKQRHVHSNINKCIKTLAYGIRHYNDVIMSAMASRITGVSVVRSTVCSGEKKTTSKLHVTCLCEGISPVTGKFPSKKGQ